jgi:chorismate mutase
VAPTAGHDEPLLALTDVAAQPVQLADTVAAAKWGTDAPINDPIREQAVLDAVATKLRQHRIEHTRHLDPLHNDALTRALVSICRQPG